MTTHHPIVPALLLRAIGMHPKYAGYGYLMSILSITNRSPELVYRLPQAVYPKIMEHYACTRCALDRNIRFAIDRTWQDGNQAVLAALFGAFNTTWRPTNMEFICVLTEAMLSFTAEELFQLSTDERFKQRGELSAS